jgi:GTP cyclohydrolase III
MAYGSTDTILALQNDILNASQHKAERRDKLLIRLRELKEPGDTEVAHMDADNALLDFIDDGEVREAFCLVPKWYA